MKPKNFPWLSSNTCSLATSILAPILGAASLPYTAKSACT